MAGACRTSGAGGRPLAIQVAGTRGVPIRYLLALAAIMAQPLAAQDAVPAPELPELSLEQQTSLRCGVAFAVVAQGQKAADPAFAQYPQLGDRGREFFVRTTAQLMETTGAGREAVGMMVIREVKALTDDPAAVGAVMPACLLMLDASGL